MKMLDELNYYAAKDGLAYTYEDIVRAYDEVLDSCCFFKPFSCGGLKCPPNDAAHFEDCRILFLIDFIILVVSLVVIIAYIIVGKVKKISIIKPKTYLVTAIVTICLPLVIGALASIDFSTAFRIFHYIFFPGKTNWFFIKGQNLVICIFPQGFFIVCAIVIAAVIIICCTLLIVLYCIKKKKLAKKND